MCWFFQCAKKQKRRCLFIVIWGCNSYFVLNFWIQYILFNCYNSQINSMNWFQNWIKKNVNYITAKNNCWSCYKSFEFKRETVTIKKIQKEIKNVPSLHGWFWADIRVRRRVQPNRSWICTPLHTRTWREPLSL